MQSVLVSLLVMGASIAVSLGGLHLVRKHYPHPVRQANNEVAGFFIAVLGVVYAVLLAFVVVVVWEQFETARTTVEQEGNALIAVYRLASGLPDPISAGIRTTARQYATSAIDDEWPAMDRFEKGVAIPKNADELWAQVTTYEAATERERLIQAEILRRMSDLNDSRRLRELAARTGIPRILWGVLIGGAIVTVVFTYFFSTPNPRAQYVMTALYTATIAFVLMLVSLIDFPFHGDVRVSPESFELALQTMARLSGR
jgi:hypothetical protein